MISYKSLIKRLQDSYESPIHLLSRDYSILSRDHKTAIKRLQDSYQEIIEQNLETSYKLL